MVTMEQIVDDNIYTISFDVRNTLSEGEFIILKWATDNFLNNADRIKTHPNFKRGNSGSSEFDNWHRKIDVLISFLMLILLLTGFCDILFIEKLKLQLSENGTSAGI